jgi:hypothetical protein
LHPLQIPPANPTAAVVGEAIAALPGERPSPIRADRERLELGLVVILAREAEPDAFEVIAAGFDHHEGVELGRTAPGRITVNNAPGEVRSEHRFGEIVGVATVVPADREWFGISP